MTNRNSKTHALVDANAWRPKSGRRGHGGAAIRRRRARVAAEKRQEFKQVLWAKPAAAAKKAAPKKAATKKAA